MKQINDEIYKSWKILILELDSKNNGDLKNAWDIRSDMKKIPSVIVYRWIKNDRVDYDINPLGNTEIINTEEIWLKIEELVINHLIKQKEYEKRFSISWYFKISTELSEEIAEKIYDLLINYIK